MQIQNSLGQTYLVEEEIQEILQENFTAPAVTNFEEFFSKFVFNNKLISESSLKVILSGLDFSDFKNINKIYLLSIEEFSEYQTELEMCDIDGMLFRGTLGIHNAESGNLVVCLEHHDEDGMSHFDKSVEVILTFLHEAGHANQHSSNHPHYIGVVDFLRDLYDYYPFEDDSIDLMEEDAEMFGHSQMDKIMDYLESIGKKNVFLNLIDWSKIEF